MGNLDKITWITTLTQCRELSSSLFTFLCSVTRIIPKNIHALYISLFCIFCIVSSLSSLLYEPFPSFSYFVFVHMDNFWSYWAILFGYSSWTESFRVSFYYSGIHLDNFWSYRTLLSWLFIMNRDLWGLFLLFKLVLLYYCSGLSLCSKLLLVLIWNHNLSYFFTYT